MEMCVLTTQGGTAGIGSGHQPGREHDSTSLEWSGGSSQRKRIVATENGVSLDLDCLFVWLFGFCSCSLLTRDAKRARDNLPWLSCRCSHSSLEMGVGRPVENKALRLLPLAEQRHCSLVILGTKCTVACGLQQQSRRFLSLRSVLPCGAESLFV